MSKKMYSPELKIEIIQRYLEQGEKRGYKANTKPQKQSFSFKAEQN